MAPETFSVKFQTSKGSFTIEANRAWAPNGVDRLHELVTEGFFDGVRFFRVLPGFVAQFGIHGDPKLASAWRDRNIEDDEVVGTNARGTITFATAGPGTRTTQLFVNFRDNAGLDGQGFSPIAKVTDGMEVVDELYAGYGEGAPSGRGPDQGRLQREGNAYLEADFPKLDYVESATFVE